MNEAIPAPPPLPSSAALFLDVDGTLLEIAARPELVVTPPSLPALLAQLARKRGGAMALISGRPIEQLDYLFKPWKGYAAGLHGSERREGDEGITRTPHPIAASAIALLRPRLEAFALGAPGIMIEDKAASLAVHYRNAPEREAEILALTAELHRPHAAALRLIRGKMVVELSPSRIDKGVAIDRFMQSPPFRGRLPVFLGDDVTDEDGFRTMRRLDGIGIRVGDAQPSAAMFRLPDVASALAWLAT